jgi:hypothetical protein
MDVGQFPASRRVQGTVAAWSPRFVCGQKEPGRRAIIIAGLFGALPLSNYYILYILLLPYYFTELFTPS